MYRISAITNIAFGIMFSINFWGVVDGKLSFASLFIFPVAYGVMYFIVSIFVWDKRKQFYISVSTPVFTKGEIIIVGSKQQTVVVLNVHDYGYAITLTVYPLKESKYKILNIARLQYAKTSYWLRNKFK